MTGQLLIPVVSAIVAASVSVSVVFLTRRSETVKHLQSLKTAGYVDFIRGVAGVAVLQKGSIECREDCLKEGEFVTLVADAKARIAIYGSNAVVTSMAQFLRGGAVLNTPERARAFTAICQQMRNDSRPRLAAVTDEDVYFLLFGSDMKQPM